MKTIDRRAIVLGAGALALAACAPGARVAGGGGGRKKPKGGIGGTGIVGTLTDFGSLLVNGLLIETGPNTRVTDAFGARDLGALALGQSLTIEARSELLFGSETAAAVYEAIRVHITHPVIGRVDSVDPTGRQALVAGVTVTLEPGALGRFVPGARMAVSGVWRGTEVIASRIEPAARQGADVVAGEIGQGAKPTIGGRPLLSRGADVPPPGTFVTALGRSGPQGFAAEKLVSGRFFDAAGALVALSIEGYLEPVDTAPRYAISGLGHSFDKAASLQPLASTRAVFRGGYDGTFVVEDGLILPESFAERRKLLAGIRSGRLEGAVRSTRP